MGIIVTMIIAQITDTHIRREGDLAYGKVDTAGFLARAVAHLNTLPIRPDVALVTGDICDFGLAEEYELAKSLLNGLAMPYFVVPGNHDRADALRQVFDDHSYLPNDDFMCYVVDTYPVRLIGMDTTEPGEAGGVICDRRRRWLANELNKELSKPTLMFMHHPPFHTGIRHMDVQNCRGGEALGALIAAHPQVQMVLCGHVHRDISVLWHGTMASIAPSPAHAVSLDFDPDGEPAFHMEPPACRLVYLSGEGRLVAHLSYIGEHDGPHPFFDDSGGFLS
jgi:3',5'-cyclic-AMP phosphodiesterase